MSFRNHIKQFERIHYKCYEGRVQMTWAETKTDRNVNREEKITSGLEYNFLKDGVYFQNRNMKVIVIALFSD